MFCVEPYQKQKHVQKIITQNSTVRHSLKNDLIGGIFDIQVTIFHISRFYDTKPDMPFFSSATILLYVRQTIQCTTMI